MSPSKGFTRCGGPSPGFLWWRAKGFGLGTDIQLSVRGWTIRATVRIGTSGWHYRHWKGNFYPTHLPSSGYLRWYARHLDTVEINNCFYRLPTESAVAAWRDETPRRFCFAVKGSRFITHIKRLRDAQSALETYLGRMEGLQSKLGPILFQLPPNWHVNTERLEEFLAALPSKRHDCVVEFRDPTWYTSAVYDLLRKYHVGLCVHDWQGQRSPTELTADHTYIRFHGATGKYQGNYTDEMLRTWAELIRQWIPRVRDIRIYFNNDQGGHAVRNALTLQSWFAEADVKKPA